MALGHFGTSSVTITKIRIPDSEKAAAEAFLEYLQTDDSMEVFEKYGFAPIETADDAADSEETEVEETTETPEATEEAE